VAKFTMSIPHTLSREEAKRRLQDALANVRRQHGGVVQVTEDWQGDVLNFVVTAVHQKVTGQVFIEDDVARVEADLPWMLRMLAGPIIRRIEQQGFEALENKAPPGDH
jgi:Putative polyhydroxyalkanoic acid system protein (PHA_gran_rgn)